MTAFCANKLPPITTSYPHENPSAYVGLCGVQIFTFYHIQIIYDHFFNLMIHRNLHQKNWSTHHPTPLNAPYPWPHEPKCLKWQPNEMLVDTSLSDTPGPYKIRKAVFRHQWFARTSILRTSPPPPLPQLTSQITAKFVILFVFWHVLYFPYGGRWSVLLKLLTFIDDFIFNTIGR